MLHLETVTKEADVIGKKKEIYLGLRLLRGPDCSSDRRDLLLQ